MEHVVTIEDEISTTQIYLDNQNKLCGFCVKGNKLQRIDVDIIDKLRVFFLGQNRETLGVEDGYEVVLDKDTNLVHYLKDGKDDFEKLIMMNGEDAHLYSKLFNSYRGKCVGKEDKIKIITKGISVILKKVALGLFIARILPLAFLILSDMPIRLSGEFVNISDAISYVFTADDENALGKPIDEYTIESLIYNSPNIQNEDVKDFLWNESFIRDVLPYYEGTPMEIISKFRFGSLNILPFSSKDKERHGELVLGYYAGDGNLHVDGYEEDKFDKESSQANTTAHEYIHLLQTSDGFRFIIESMAEVIAQEYFLSSSNSEDIYCYSTGCKYLKVLMEIVGPEAIWEEGFRKGSTKLVDSVRPYLDDQDFELFVHIMEMSPERYLEYGDDLEKLLGTLYKNKFGKDMSEDRFIRAILSGEEYDRAYFNRELIESRESYYMARTVDRSIAFEMGLLEGQVGGIISYDQFIDDEFFPGGTKSCTIFSEETFAKNDLYVEDNRVKGTVTLLDGTILTVEEAIARGLIKPICSFQGIVRSESEYEKYKAFVLNYLTNGVEYDERKSIVKLEEPIKIVIPPITEKFQMKQGMVRG